MDVISGALEELMVVLRGWGATVDVWVAKNVSKQAQTYFLFTMLVCMVLHLVYTKRRVLREHKEEEAEKKSQEGKKKK